MKKLCTIMIISLMAIPTIIYAQQKQDEPEKKLTDKEMLQKSQENLKKMRNIYKDILSLLDDARREKDIVKVNCINENLTAIKALLKIAEQSDVALQEAVIKKDEVVAQHEFEKVEIAYQKAKALYQEANACAGKISMTPGETKVEVEEPKDITERDPTIEPKKEVIVLERPPRASPYQ
ncbi:MAG: hypothetical protein N2746_05695 [Deltaproteobacteria bacterium]|nr:hypothetical protein [Deltaproteobacteria bacterium]